MNYLNKKVEIIGVPIDLGSEPLGVEMGAAAIRYAGLIEALKYNKIRYNDYGDIEIDKKRGKEKNGQIKEISRVSNKLADIVNNAIEQKYIPIILGGDHSAAIGSIAGSAKKNKNLGLIWLDCHPDINTPTTSPTGNIHGMTVAISIGQGHEKLVSCGGFSPKLKADNICMIGVKDIDSGEKEILKNNKIKYFTNLDIARYGIVEVVKEAIKTVKNCDGIHLSFDIDVLDPLIAPGTGITSRGGLSYREISYIMNALGKLNIITSIDIIEINPLLDIRNQTAELAVELLLFALGGSYGEYERNYIGNIE